MIILGIDPGTATTGFGLIKKTGKQNPEYEIVDFGVISTLKTDSDAKRLQILFSDLTALIKKYKPHKIGVEKLFFTSNQTTAMTVSQARGIVLLASQQAGLEISEFTPLQIKNTLCGYGRADKKQIQTVVQQTFKLKNVPKPDDAADALAIALCAAWRK
ncbi:TPA: crossover junction endodeoxyribonuclease RuvC [Patescibacteria group bacterium]|jgi:crossover junction endodeoxyribonuclease RuvC|nr:crossover junction endodeoxyribonuclease RuvC [Patescibacteria group bacterium]